PRVRPPLSQRLGIAMARPFRPLKPFPIPLNDPELFTATPHWLGFLRADPLALHEASARLLVESVRLSAYLRWAAPWVGVPTLLMLAGQDRIIDNARTRAFVARFRGPVEVIAYPEAHHTLEFEPNPDRHVDDLLAWFGRQSAVSARRS